MEGKFIAQIPRKISEGGIYVVPIAYEGEGKFNGYEVVKKCRKGRDIPSFHNEMRDQAECATDGLMLISTDKNFKNIEELLEEAFSACIRKISESISFGE
ncbi:MAG: hypothetical protein Q8N99_00120 [Nanoarchaeota archaeon]|nr:hypothetical protein [Nanoarchaeota archaeon]